VADATARYVDAFEPVAGALAEVEPRWLTDFRRDAIGRFAELGLPDSRDEEFRHTPVGKLLDRELRLDLPGPSEAPEDLPRFEGACGRVVFVDGRFAPEASDLPDGVRVRSFLTALREAEHGIPSWLARRAELEVRSLSALNAAYLADGALVETDRGATQTGPLHLLYVTTGAAAGRAIHLRNLLVAEPGSRLDVVEQYVGGDADAVNNIVTEVVVEEGAEVRHVKLQEEGPETVHLSAVEALLRRDARFTHRSVSIGASTGRTETRVKLAGRGACCDLSGVYLGRGTQVADQLTLVDHAVPHGTSRQVYKGILDDRARGVFNGLVIVRKDAQGTSAEQQNRNLVLTGTAEAHTRPQLLIDADDVKCSHGATVGALDAEALFYLRSRGIGPTEARRLLIRAFVADVLAGFDEGPVRDRAEGLVSEWLGGGE